MENRDRSVKIISLCLFCLFIVLLFSTATFSFAKYVSAVRSGENNVGVMEMNCTYAIEENNGLAFINSEFNTQVGADHSLQMNAFSNTVVKLSDNSVNTGLNYQYAFVLYVPTVFAKHAMFQVVHLDGNSNVAAHASKLYTFADGSGNISPTPLPANSKVDNEYDYLTDSAEGNLAITSFNVSTASAKATYKRTFKTYQNESPETILCTFDVKRTETIEFCRVVINLDASKYFLGDGESARFLLRVALLSKIEDIAIRWNPSDYDLSTIKPEEGFIIQVDEDKSLHVFYDDLEIDNVYVDNCIGVTYPSRVNVLFTQKEKL